MRVVLLLFFLTLVVSHSKAAPETSVKVEPIRTKEAEVTPKNDMMNEGTVQVTPAPFARQTRKSYRMTADATNNLAIGMASGQMKETKDFEEATVLHAQRTQYNWDESAQEFGISLLTIGLVGLDLGYKKFCCFQSFAQPLEPFYKIGISALYDPKDALGNVIDYQKYFFQIGAGFENLFSSRRTWRFEVGARSGYPGTHFFGLLIYAFPD